VLSQELVLILYFTDSYILYEEQLNSAKPYFTTRRALYLDTQTLNHFLKVRVVFAELCQKKYFHLLQEMQFSQEIL